MTLPDWFVVLCWACAGLALLPAMLTTMNLCVFRAPTRSQGSRPAVSVIVPVRNEEAAVGDCIRALLASTDVDLEIVVVDDQSTDRTAAIVARFAAEHSSVRLCPAPPLPPGWSGKQHACHAGATQARNPVLLFIDCDVRVKPAAVAAMAGYLETSGADLVSGFPHEQTLTFGEILLIPLIHVLLLGYLPMLAMRLSRQVGFGTGCGQLMVARAVSYRSTGGHAMVRASWHDGLQLPRAFRQRGYRTDIFDASGLATCRMYRGFAATWAGLAKNAREGMATPTGLPVWTILLGGGMVAPFLLAPFALAPRPLAAAGVALVVSAAALLLTRLAVAVRFRHSLLAVPLLPVGVSLLLLLQWQALLARPDRAARQWRGRTQVQQ